jgi:acetyl-CoA C-acetyltransferase
MAREKALDLGCPVLATVRSQASAGIDMKFILIAPTLAIPKVLKKEGIRIEDVDLFEINEAFAGSTVTVIRELGIDMDKVNVNGGAIALGHPIGASGARVLTTLIYEMIRQDKKTGLASLCLGGGEAVALIIRRDA